MMAEEKVQLKLDANGRGFFYIGEEKALLGRMDIGISGNHLTVYHTEVYPEGEGRGLGKLLLGAMVDHARQKGLKVIPLCPFVHAQFKRHPQAYADVWEDGHRESEKEKG